MGKTREKREKRRRKEGKGERCQKHCSKIKSDIRYLIRIGNYETSRKRPVEKRNRLEVMRRQGGKVESEFVRRRGGKVKSELEKERNKKEEKKKAVKKLKKRSSVDVELENYRVRRTPIRETKARKKGGNVRQVPSAVGTKRGGFRVGQRVMDGRKKGSEGTGEGRQKGRRVELGAVSILQKRGKRHQMKKHVEAPRKPKNPKNWKEYREKRQHRKARKGKGQEKQEKQEPRVVRPKVSILTPEQHKNSYEGRAKEVPQNKYTPKRTLLKVSNKKTWRARHQENKKFTGTMREQQAGQKQTKEEAVSK